jgi:phospholipid transport system substrate-binding protein
MLPTAMPTEPTRRRALALLAAAALAAPRAAAALDAGTAERLVRSLVDDINAVINSGKSERAMYRDFERLFELYADVPTIARFTLGVDARRASAAQLRAYTEAYRERIAVTYGSRFREFIGGRLEVRETRPLPRRGRTDYEVRTTAFLRGEDPFEVTFLVSDASGEPLFYNAFIEGVNMLLTERTEIGAMLDQRGGDIDALIRALEA